MAGAFHADGARGMHLDIASRNAEVSAAGSEQDFLFGVDLDPLLAGGDGHILVGRDFHRIALRLDLHLALGRDQFHRGFVLHPGHEQADVFADVVNPAPAGGVVGISLSDEVEVRAGS